MSRTGGDIDQLLGLRDELAVVARDVADVGRDVGRALSSFAGSSREHVPALPAHRAELDGLAHGVDLFAREVRDGAQRLAAADGPLRPTWAPGVDELGRPSGPGAMASDTLGAVFSVANAKDAATVLGAGGWMGAAHGRLLHLASRWGDADAIPMAHYRHVTGNPVGVANNRTLTPLKRAQELRNAALRTDLDAVLDRGRSRLQRVSWHGAGQLDELTAAGSRGGRVARIAGVGNRLLGPAGVAWSFGQSVGHLGDGEWADATADAASAVGGVLLLTGFPPAQVVGAVLTVGALAWDHRETLGRGAGAVGRGAGAVGRGASSLVEGAKSLLGGLF